MFTGIVETTAAVLDRTDTGLLLERPATFDDLMQGSSVSVAGVCLSVVELLDSSMRFDVIPETWAKTNLGDRRKGDRVNVERSMKANGRFEGHMVQGHIEGTAVAEALRHDDRWVILTVTVGDDLLPYIVHKGGIALDGVSLTVAGLEGNKVSIALIPHTLSVTSFRFLHAGDRVNVETDVIGRYVAKMIRERDPS